MSATAFQRRRRELAALAAKEAEAAKPKTPSQMNKMELVAYATEKGLTVTEDMTKAQILEALAAKESEGGE